MTESGARLVLWALGAGLVGAMLAIPQPVDPWEMPSLVLDRVAVKKAVQDEEALASILPEDEHVDRVRALFLEHGTAEIGPNYTRVDYESRQMRIHRALDELEAAVGKEAFAALRAQAVEEYISRFGDGLHEPESEEETGMVGGFTTMLERYGVVEDGVLVAPRMTLRAMYKARWNLIHRVEGTDGFSPIEAQAYWGWLALHGWGVPLNERIEALLRYKAAGGRNAEEAAALFDLLEQRPNQAANILEALYRRSHQLRLRNLALGAVHAAATALR